MTTKHTLLNDTFPAHLDFVMALHHHRPCHQRGATTYAPRLGFVVPRDKHNIMVHVLTLTQNHPHLATAGDAGLFLPLLGLWGSGDSDCSHPETTTGTGRGGDDANKTYLHDVAVTPLWMIAMYPFPKSYNGGPTCPVFGPWSWAGEGWRGDNRKLGVIVLRVSVSFKLYKGSSNECPARPPICGIPSPLGGRNGSSQQSKERGKRELGPFEASYYKNERDVYNNREKTDVA
ncbi:hypothetical protein BJV78DRAFT_1155445 [Lactifluus subvellereus]|nr:hypothetical protein BJV78DRAFT_1155445 [Lactifluus subvellereus]